MVETKTEHKDDFAMPIEVITFWKDDNCRNISIRIVPHKKGFVGGIIVMLMGNGCMWGPWADSPVFPTKEECVKKCAEDIIDYLDRCKDDRLYDKAKRHFIRNYKEYCEPSLF